MSDPIWITGIGVASPHGLNFREVADGLMAGISVIEQINEFDVSQHPCQLGAILKTVPLVHQFESIWNECSKLEKLAIWCIANAIEDAGFANRDENLKIGLILGNPGEWAYNWENESILHPNDVPCSPDRDRRPLIDFVKSCFQLTGPTAIISTACSTGNYALSQARRWMQHGWCDVVLAGSCDCSITPLTLAGFGNLRATTRKNDIPKAASRPFDIDRDGFVLGEGGAILVLEKSSNASRRSARVYGELAGVGLSSDAHHPVIPSPVPTYAIEAITKSLKDARIDSSEVSYVNAHGTSTPVGDQIEAKAIREALGENYRRIPVSATKSMSGHLLTAASAFEAIACLAAIDRQMIPPTINLDHPDPECELRHVPHVAIEAKVNIAISNSFGFGGSNSCAIFKRV